jgi:beta-lactamase class A
VAAPICCSRSWRAARTVNDVGIVTLPDAAGHLILSVYIRGAKAETATCERTIAEVARTLYDYALFA